MNFLIRETQELKKDIQLKKKTIENKDREIQKLLSKIQKFLSSKDDGDNLDDEELEVIDFAKEKFHAHEPSPLANSKGSLAEAQLQGVPSLLKYPSEVKKNIEYRFKAMGAEER